MAKQKPPQISDEQRRAALEKAAAARTKRAEMKALLSTGSLTLEDVFTEAEADEIVAGTKVYPLLVAMPGMGKVKAMRLMEDIDIAENRKIRGLGTRQRERLLEHFS
jgi:S13-like H2TH domain